MPKKLAREEETADHVPLDGLAELQGIRLYSLALQLGAQALDPPYDLGITISPSAEVKGTNLRYDIQYAVSGTKGVSETEDTATVLSLQCTYQVSYSIPEGTPLAADEVQAFGATTVLTTVHPYLRELLSDVSARGGLPPITLGSMRLKPSAA